MASESEVVTYLKQYLWLWRGVSKGVEDGCRPPALRAGHPWNDRKFVLGVARLVGVEG
jgi:hypothetical protein